jgi:uncharacterized protein YidB (DUF937 family)
MALFDSLVDEVNAKFNLNGKAQSLLAALLAFMNDTGSGGLDGFLDLFRRAGFDDAADSWVGDGANAALSPQQLEDALGAGTINDIAEGAGVEQATATSALAFMIPQVVDRLTTGGTATAATDLASTVDSYTHGTPAGTGDMPDRPAAVIDDSVGRRPAMSVEPVGNDNTTVRWIAPLLILLALVGIGFYACRPAPVTNAPATTNVNNQGTNINAATTVNTNAAITTATNTNTAQ